MAAADIPDPASALREAAVWFDKVHADSVSEGELALWQHWLTASAANRKAFGDVEHFWTTSGGLVNAPSPTREEIADDDYDGSIPIAVWHQRRAAIKRRPWSSWRPWRTPIAVLAAGTALALLLSLILLRVFPATPRLAVYETPVREHRSITLQDGTTVLLGAQTVLSVEYSDLRRSVVLETGEAFFQVQHDGQRPFVVRAGRRIVTAIGTAFNVETQSGRVVVTVVEGSVDVADLPFPERQSDVETRLLRAAPPAPPRSMRVSAGERMTYMESAVPAVERVDPSRALTWREGRLAFTNEPLGYVIQDVARYTNLQLVIKDAEVEQLLYTGALMKDEVDDWLMSLEQVFPIRVERVADDCVVLQLRKTNSRPLPKCVPHPSSEGC